MDKVFIIPKKSAKYENKYICRTESKLENIEIKNVKIVETKTNGSTMKVKIVPNKLTRPTKANMYGVVNIKTLNTVETIVVRFLCLLNNTNLYIKNSSVFLLAMKIEKQAKNDKCRDGL